MTASRHVPSDLSQHPPRLARKGARASLSVVIVSTGDVHTLTAAIARLAPKCRELEAELVVVRANDDLAAQSALHPYPGLRYLTASADSSLRELRDLGMREASGDMIAIRSDDEVEDTRWLAPFRRYVALSVTPIAAPAGAALSRVFVDGSASLAAAET